MRVVSLNTGRNESDFFRRMDAMARGLVSLNPDVVFLQEVLSVPGERIDASLEFARRLGMHHEHQAQRLKPRVLYGDRVSSTSGLTVLSRVPARSLSSVVLPTVPEDGERVSQVVSLDLQTPSLLLVNVHLTFLPGPEGDKLRMEQIRLTIDEAERGGPARTVIVAGDFNAAPGDAAFDSLASDRRFDFGPGPLDDLPPTYLGGLVRASRTGGLAIDHIAVYHPLGTPSLRIAGRFLALTEPDVNSGVMPSDHAAVVADLVEI
jgi:endonuclease/exonuclease/phosphatase family metal-dependent hydrolase